jgi:hypothetical protein
MAFVSHSVFKDQKKHQRFFHLPKQAFPVGAKDKLRQPSFSVNRFFNYFFQNKAPFDSLSAFAAGFVSNKAGHPTHLRLHCNPFFELFFRTVSRPKGTRFATVLFRTRRVIVRIKKIRATPFSFFFVFYPDGRFYRLFPGI